MANQIYLINSGHMKLSAVNFLVSTLFFLIIGFSVSFSVLLARRLGTKVLPGKLQLGKRSKAKLE